MSPYTVEISRRAVKAIAGLERADQLRIRAAIDLLAGEPRPPGCVKLAGEASAYRVRVGDLRIVYEVIDDRLVIQVIRTAHRRALEAFIGGADEPIREPFDIHRAREQLAEELLTEHQAISQDFARGRRARSSEGSRGLG